MTVGLLGMFADVLADLQANGLKFRVLVLGEGHTTAQALAKLRDVVFPNTLSQEALATARPVCLALKDGPMRRMLDERRLCKT